MTFTVKKFSRYQMYNKANSIKSYLIYKTKEIKQYSKFLALTKFKIAT